MGFCIFQDLENKLPPVIARDQVESLLGGMISSKTLANLDSLGLGVPNRFKVGRKVIYPTKSLLKWLQQRSTFPPSECEGGPYEF